MGEGWWRAHSSLLRRGLHRSAPRLTPSCRSRSAPAFPLYGGAAEGGMHHVGRAGHSRLVRQLIDSFELLFARRDVDADGPVGVGIDVYQKRYIVFSCWVGGQIIQRGGRGDGVSVFDHACDVER